jgi:hypothetical protein
MFQQLLERLALDLDGRSIPYLVIGGQAVLVHGEPRLTRDIDVTLGVGADRLDDLLGIAAGAGWNVLVGTPREFVRDTMVLPCEDPASGIRLDFIFSHTPYERHAMERATRLTIGSAEVRFASPEDLIIHKIVAGRPRDMDDVRSVLLRNPQADAVYIRRWLAELEVAVGEPLVARFEQLLKSTA